MLRDKYDFHYLNQIRKEIYLKYYGQTKHCEVPAIYKDVMIELYPDLRREDQRLTMTEIEVRRRERKARRLARREQRAARRAQRPWWLRWY